MLVLSRAYPNAALPTYGLWVRRLVVASAAAARPVVVAPVPYVPPGPLPEALGRLRRVPRSEPDGGFPVEHPRIPVGPGYLLHGLEAALAYPFVRRLADRLHRAEPFDLIHAHFIYPDGVVAARLGARWGVPVVTTEHATWLPWLADWPTVRRQVEDALPHVRTITAVSESLRRTIHQAVGPHVAVEILPNVVDDEVFTARAPDEPVELDELVFVGAVRRVKGLDLLVRALALLAPERPRLRLTVVGEPYNRAYRRDERAVRALAAGLGVAGRISFAGALPPAGVARVMRRAGVVVVPSRRESFSAVTVEALACGTPVVATRCGGPEDLLDPETGVLVPTEDPAALADAVRGVLDHRGRFDPGRLRAHVVPRFGWAAARRRVQALYAEALAAG